MKKQGSLLQYLLLIVKIYVFWIAVFVIQKPVFMLFNYQKEVSFTDFAQVILHGLKLDFCISAYFCLIPVLLSVLSVFIQINLIRIIRIYNIITGLFISLIFAVDCVLFSYWGFRMDATLIFYLHDTKNSLSSVTFKDVLHFTLLFLPYFLVLIYLNLKTFKPKLISVSPAKEKTVDTLVLLLLLPVLFICTRGGLSTATANIGMVYYSQNQFLNLSAINPAFSLMYSWTKNEDFSKEYIYMEDKECEDLFNQLYFVQKDSTEYVLNTQNPDILIIMWESLSGNAVSACGGEEAISENKEITPGLNSLAKEGIIFRNCYANAMRTDRGIVSVLTGFLAQPNTSIIKYPEKTRSLPALAKVFSEKKYSTSMLYGGDINFANMRSYFISSGYGKITSASDFPINKRLSKWGVDDETTFEFLLNDIKSQDLHQPFFKTFLTLSSHEPFDVNMKKFSDVYINSIAYTDSCLFDFISKLKKTPQWKNLLVIIVSDHGYSHPYGIDDKDRRKYHIPMLWLGGAIKEPMEVERYVNQTDIPSTLLNQLKINSKDFIYSRNVFNPYSENYAFYVFNNGFCFMDTTGYVIFDCNANQLIEGKNENNKIEKGQSLLQTLYRDISER